jgi:hypothetical protein
MHAVTRPPLTDEHRTDKCGRTEQRHGPCQSDAGKRSGTPRGGRGERCDDPILEAGWRFRLWQ